MVSIATTGAALVRSASEEGSGPSKDWEVATSALPGFMKVLTLENYGEHQCSGISQSFSDIDMSSDQECSNEDLEEGNLQRASCVVSIMKSHVAVQLLILQISFLTSYHILDF